MYFSVEKFCFATVGVLLIFIHCTESSYSYGTLTQLLNLRECLQKCRDVPAYLKHQCIAVKCRKNYDLIDPEKRLPDTTLYEYESSLLSPERNLDVNLEKIPKRESVARKAFLTGLDFRRGDIKVPAVRKRLMIGTLATCIALKCGGLQDELKDLCGVSQCHNSEKW